MKRTMRRNTPPRVEAQARGHRTRARWRGEELETLADLLAPGLRAVVVGINPSPVSLAAGHYYQGRLGKLFYARLQEAGFVTGLRPGWEDDDAFAQGVGFTDLVKRPSARAHHLDPADFAAGRAPLLAKLEAARPRLVLFSYKRSAEVLCGRFRGHGRVPGLEVAGAPAFVMPGPMERRDRVAAALDELRELAP